MMKKFTIIIFACLLAGSSVSCNKSKKSSTEEAADRLGKMEVVIPAELEDNPEIVAYIEGMSEVVDGYALLLDETIPKLDGYQDKTFDDLKMGEKLKLTKIAAEVSMKSAPLMTKWAELEARKSVVEVELTEEEILALQTLVDRFEKRLQQIEERNQEFFEGV